MTFECVSRTHVGLRRKINEDSILVRTEYGLWAVADGMGGHDAGEVASSKVVEALSELPVRNDPDASVESAIAALERANRELIALAAARGTDRSIGTTVAGLAIAGGQYRCFWAGDSRAYRIRDQEIIQLTRDHSLVQSLVDAGMLEPAQAVDHPNASVITRAVGVAEELRVDIVSGEARSRDLFLLASDGLTRMVEDREILSEIMSRPLEAAADNLVATVLQRGAPDNVSLIIVKVI